MTLAVAILMIITSMGIFGFLSKAHSDQSLVSGDVLSRIAVYDEKIKTSQDNIDANRKALKQLDEAVDQVMGRSTSETGADKAVAIRKSQAKERTRLLAEITAEQKAITGLREQRAPIAAEVRKVEAEVGPIKYIAAFVYGDNPDANVLEKAVTWVIIIIVSVFDPLAVILLLASQYSFQWFRQQQDEEAEGDSPVRIQETEQPTVTKTPPVEDFKFLADYNELHSESIASNLDPVYPATETEVEELAEAKADAKDEVIGEQYASDLITAPPGTPGEAWDAPVQSEQQQPLKEDKIYKASKEDIAKRKRSRGWFNVTYPGRDDVN